MELESAIQELLSRLEFVSLPGLGSFVKKYEPASLSTDGKSFNPPREFFVFDPTRVFNDEAIENFICDREGVDHKKATTIVVKFIDSITEKLNSGNEILFRGVGVLKKNENGAIELLQSNDLHSQTFGLGQVEVETQSTLKKNAEPASRVNKVEPKVTAKPVITPKPAIAPSKSKSNVFVPIVVIFAIIAIAATVLFVPELRFWENANTDETAQIVQLNDQSGEVDEEFAVPFDSVETENESLEHLSDTLPIESVSAVTDKKAALYYQETKKEENKTFYIIAGSFTLENNAQQLINELSVKGYKPLLLQNNNMYRVAIYKFTNRDRALRELERLKSQKISDKVWLLSL